ncbi:hypothetical protein CF336_g6281 [Tilletia laevis]|nr:hypothetical protein CF336_g6281 [Tilletia laevis]KAE8192001.1 hypothetical protein CF335_g5947 [Tilletia laevis]
MPSSCSPLFLTLTPLDPFLPPQSIVFLPSDRFDLQLGGNKHEDYVRPSACPSPANFLFARHALGVEHASLSFLGDGLVGLVHNHSRDTTLVNDRRLKIAERSSLRDGDIIQLGFYESWDSSTEFVLGLQVHLQDYPARSSLAPAGDRGILFIPAPVSVFKHLHLTINRLEDLTQQLTSTQQQLKEALDRQTTHICTPPRPYGQLVNDLRSPLPNDVASDTLLPSSSPPSSASPLSSVLNRSLSASSPSSSSASESSASLASTSRPTSSSSTSAPLSSRTSRSASPSSPPSSTLSPTTPASTSSSSQTVPSSARTSSTSYSALSSTSVLTSVLPSSPPTLLPEPSSSPQLDIDQHSHDVPDAAGVVSAIFNSRPEYVDGTADEHQCPHSAIISAPSSHRSSVSQAPSSYSSMLSSMDVALSRVGAGWIHARREVVRVSDYPARSSAANRVRTAESLPSPLDVALSRIRTALIAARRFMPVSSSSSAADTSSTRVSGVLPPTASGFPTMEQILAQASGQSTSSCR